MVAKVNCFFVFHINNSKKLCRLIYLITFTVIVKLFVEREKNREDNNDMGQGNRAYCIN